MANQSIVRLASRHAFMLSVLPALSLTLGAAAQSASQVIIKSDDGAAPQVMHFTMPDFMELRQPDFIRRDVPIFSEKLVLSDEQTAVVQKLIDDYLQSFKKLTEAHLPKVKAPMTFALGGGKDGEGPAFVMAGPGDEGPEGAIDVDGGDVDGAIDELPDLIGLQGDMPGKMAVGVSVRVGGPDGEAPDDAENAEPGVAISLATPDGEPIPEEMRKKLEEAASKIAAEVKARMEKQAAEGGNAGGDDEPMLPFGGSVNIEEMQKHQQEMEQKAEEFRKAKADLRQSFVNDVQTKLAEPQIEHWPDLERTLRREKTLPKGRLSGERTDLVKVLKGLDLSEPDRRVIAEPLESYETAMDSALRQRNEFIPSAETKINKAMQEGDIDKALSIIDRATALRVAVRSVNEQFTDALSQLMPSEKAQAFRNAVQRASYPLVYRTTFAQKTFTAARKIDGVDPKTLASIAELEKAYGAELGNVNEQIRQALSKTQPLEPRKVIENLKAIKEGQPPADMMLGDSASKDPVRAAFDKRRDLDDRYVKLVRDMLPPDQAEQLPKQASRRNAGPLIIRRGVPDGAK